MVSFGCQYIMLRLLVSVSGSAVGGLSLLWVAALVRRTSGVSFACSWVFSAFLGRLLSAGVVSGPDFEEVVSPEPPDAEG